MLVRSWLNCWLYTHHTVFTMMESSWPWGANKALQHPSVPTTNTQHGHGWRLRCVEVSRGVARWTQELLLQGQRVAAGHECRQRTVVVLLSYQPSIMLISWLLWEYIVWFNAWFYSRQFLQHTSYFPPLVTLLTRISWSPQSSKDQLAAVDEVEHMNSGGQRGLIK